MNLKIRAVTLTRRLKELKSSQFINCPIRVVGVIMSLVPAVCFISCKQSSGAVTCEVSNSEPSSVCQSPECIVNQDLLTTEGCC